MECRVTREDISDGIVSKAMDMALASKAFEKVAEDTLIAKQGADFQAVVNDINTQFGEQILTKEDESFSIAPSEALITQYINRRDIQYSPSSEAVNLYNLKHTGTLDEVQNTVLSMLANETISKDLTNILSKKNDNYFLSSTRKGMQRTTGDDRSIILNGNKQRLINFLNWYKINPAIFTFEQSTTADGEDVVKVVKNTGITLDKLGVTEKKDRIKAITDFLGERLGLKDNIVHITRADFRKQFPNVYKSNMTSVVVGDKIYLFENETTNDIVAEELLHPFILGLEKTNIALFNNLLTKAKQDFPGLSLMVENLYKDQGQRVKDRELITKVLALHFNNEQENNPSKSFKDTVADFVKWIGNLIKDMAEYFGYTRVENEALPANLSFDDIAKLLNTTDTKFDVAFTDEGQYNIKEEEKVKKEAFDYVWAGIGEDTERIEKIFAKLPEAVKGMVKRVEQIGESSEESRKLRELIKQAYTLQDKESQVKSEFNMIITVSRILNEIDNNLNYIDRNEKDNKQRLYHFNNTYKALDTLDPFIKLMEELKDELTRTVGKPSVASNEVTLNTLKVNRAEAEKNKDFTRVGKIDMRIKEVQEEVNKATSYTTFYNQLNAAMALPNQVKSKIARLSYEPILEELVKWNEPLVEAPLARLTELLRQEKAKEKPDTKKIKKIEDEIELLPTREHFEKKFAGLMVDASSGRNLLDSKANNPDALIASMMGMIDEINDKANAHFLGSTNAIERAQAERDAVIGDVSSFKNRSIEEHNKPILSSVKWAKRAFENEDGTIDFDWVEPRELLNEVDPEYLHQYSKLYSEKAYYIDKIIEARRAKDDAAFAKYDALQKDLYQRTRAWLNENAQREYFDEVYEMYETLDRPLGEQDGKSVTLRSAKGVWYEMLERAEENLRKEIIPENREILRDEIKEYKQEIKQIANRFDEDNNPKEGIPLALAEAAQRYTELRKKYGDYIMSDEGAESFAADLEILKNRFDIGEIDKPTYDYQLSRMVKEEISQEYFDLRDTYKQRLKEITAEIMENEDLASNFDPDTKSKLDTIYDIIAEEVRPYRDEDGVIDGQFLSKDNPGLVKRIKERQQAIEEIRQTALKLKGLSSKEQNELQSLFKKQDKTDDEIKRLEELQAKSQAKASIYRENKPLIDKYNRAIRNLFSLAQHVDTHYYTAESDRQFNLLKATPGIQDFVNNQLQQTTVTARNQTYERRGDKWYVQIDDMVGNEPFDEGYIRGLLEGDEARRQMKSTDWWNDNHYKSLRYNESSHTYEETDTPLYIWSHQVPANEEFIKKDQPSNTYKTYTIKDEYENKNFRTIAHGIPAPREGKFANQRYTDLQNATDAASRAHFKYLTFMRNFFKTTNMRIPERKNLGDFLPSMIKTHNERTVELTNEAFSSPGKFIKDLKGRTFQIALEANDEDVAYATGGSLGNTQAPPLRFTSKIDKSLQSADISAMALAYDLTTSRYTEINAQLPLFESIQRITKELGVVEAKTVVDRMLSSATKKVYGKEFRPKNPNNQSNLSKGIDETMNMFVYGQMSKPKFMNIFGRRIDVQKATSGFLGWTAKTIFIGGLFPGIKNSIATRLELIKQANKYQGFYGLSNIARAQGQLFTYMRDFANDYTKGGNRSFIGQMMQLYSVTAEDIMRHTNEKINYNLGADKFTFMMAPKAFSEFEAIVLQWLTLADAHMVKFEDGTSKPLVQAYELKDGVLQLKPGAQFSDRDRLIFREKFQKITRDISGAYRESEKSEFETEWYGKAAMFMSKYLVPGINTRIGRKQWSMEYGDITEGFYSSALKSISELVKDYHGNIRKFWNNASASEKASLVKFGREFLIVTSMWIAIGLMGGGGGPDQKKRLQKNSWVYNYMIAEMIASKTETETFVPWAGFGLDDLLRKAQSPFMAVRQLIGIAKMMQLAQFTIMGDDEAYYKQKTALHDKGDSKLAAQFWKIVAGFTGKGFEPIEMIKGQQALTRMR